MIFVESLESLGGPYLIGGSLASSLFGSTRATLDADILADLRPEHAQSLQTKLGQEFYLDLDAMREAIRRRGSFNAIHMETAFKIDVFVPRNRPFDRMELQRRQRYEVGTSPPRSAYFASPEDVILARLEWYLSGGEVSDRQWNDILAVLKVQGDRLDRQYLQQWAEELGVGHLLERALREGEE
jgi:hypothetical protein